MNQWLKIDLLDILDILNMINDLAGCNCGTHEVGF